MMLMKSIQILHDVFYDWFFSSRPLLMQFPLGLAYLLTRFSAHLYRPQKFESRFLICLRVFFGRNRNFECARDRLVLNEDKPMSSIRVCWKDAHPRVVDPKGWHNIRAIRILRPWDRDKIEHGHLDLPGRGSHSTNTWYSKVLVSKASHS